MRKLTFIHTLFLVLFLALGIFSVASPASAQIAVGISVHVGPPALRVYVQPPCPAEGYIWTPGYWGYRAGAYVWTPGAWVLPAQPGLLFTPGYWDLVDGVYLWRGGHWGVHVGYYGGVNYGFGYPGAGFFGGRWEGGHFFYNRAYSNVDGARFHHVYHDERFGHERGREDHRADRREDRREDRRSDRRGDRREDHKED